MSMLNSIAKRNKMMEDMMSGLPSQAKPAAAAKAKPSAKSKPAAKKKSDDVKLKGSSYKPAAKKKTENLTAAERRMRAMK